MKRIVLSINLLAVLLLSSCQEEKSQSIKDTTTPVTVTTYTISDQTSANKISVSGSVEAANTANLSTRNSGYVDRVLVSLGDKVQKGELLIKINNADLSAKLAQSKANVAEAQAAYQTAKKDYERYQSLFNKKSATQKELDDMQANFKMAQARLNAAQEMKKEVQAQFSYTNIKAPFKGLVTSKNIQEGDLANPGQVLMRLEGEKTLQIVAMVPESQINSIQKNKKASVIISSIEQELKGEVVEMSPSAQNTGGQYLVKVKLLNPSQNIKPGMFARVNFANSAKSTVEANNPNVLIPKAAIVKQGQLTGVYTISQKNTAILRWLRLGKTYGDQVEVLSGLKTGETIIRQAEGKLYNGVKLTQK